MVSRFALMSGTMTLGTLVGRDKTSSDPVCRKSCVRRKKLTRRASSLCLLALMQAFSTFFESRARSISRLDVGGVKVFVLLIGVPGVTEPNMPKSHNGL